jgi:molecular chaperone GrpE
MAHAKREEEKVIPIDGAPFDRESDASNVSDDPSSNPQTEGDVSLAEQFEKLKAEKEELMQTMIRRQADFENFRKRTERDRLEEGRRGVERLITDLIPVLDGFDRALQGHEDPAYEEYRKGVTLIRKQLWDTISKHGVQRIEAAGKMFDPNLHQAIERFETEDVPDGTIVAVFQDGYQFHGRVLRPAIVRVAVNSADDAQSDRHAN